MNKNDCDHNEREWIDPKFFNEIKTDYDNGIGIKTKCRLCGIEGYEVYNFSNFEVDEN